MKKIVLLFLTVFYSCFLSGQIVYTDIIPDVNYSCNYASPPWGSCSNYYDIDINNDGILDFKFNYSKDQNQYGSHEGDRIVPYNSNTMVDSAWFGYPIQTGDTIDSSNNWGTGGTFYSYSELMGGSPQISGIWPYNATDYFVGLRLVVGANIYYGWVRKNYYTIKDYAYEYSKNYIVAGQLPPDLGVSSNVENNLQFTLSPNPANNTISVATAIKEEGFISILNFTGQLILKRNYASQDKLDIDISSLAKGLYFIKLSTSEGSVVRKFVKE